MIKDIHITELPKKTLSVNPKKFLLWLFMVSIVMIFASLTSAYIVRQAEGNWLQYKLPVEFWATTAILLLSSFSVQWAYRATKRDDISRIKVYLSITLLLGLLFLAGQVYVWSIMVDHDVYFVGNPGGSFLYVLTGVHGFHLISGLIYLIIMLIKTIRYKVHSRNSLQMSLCVTYWHFLDALWIYLFVFLLLNN